jgi:hypothetical protein
LRAYLERAQLNVLPKSPEGMAIAYTLSNWKALRRNAASRIMPRWGAMMAVWRGDQRDGAA